MFNLNVKEVLFMYMHKILHVTFKAHRNVNCLQFLCERTSHSMTRNRFINLGISKNFMQKLV
jgi:hypothetical protein